MGLTNEEIIQAIDAGNFSLLEQCFNGTMYRENVFIFPTDAHTPKDTYEEWSSNGYIIMRKFNKLYAGVVINRIEDYRV